MNENPGTQRKNEMREREEKEMEANHLERERKDEAGENEWCALCRFSHSNCSMPITSNGKCARLLEY